MNDPRAAATPAILDDPLRHRGVAFTPPEREALGPTGSSAGQTAG